MSKQKFAIIDANALIHRAFHALPPLMTKDGVLVNAVYGFANILLKVLKDIKPDYIAVCFDVSRETFRTKMYAAYKAQRERGPEELYQQITLVKELVKAFNMTSFAERGFEADDLIGTLVSKIQNTTNKKQGNQIESVIVTGDMDALQLINDHTKVYTLRKGVSDTIIYDAAGVKNRYGFGPDYVLDYKALRGDPSDNIPGVKGIGEKTASELIINFGHLEKLYEFIDNLNKLAENKLTEKLITKNLKKSIYDKLINHKKEAFLSKQLAAIKCDVPLDFNLENLKIKPFDAPRVVELFQNWNFKSLISRLPPAEKIIIKGQTSLFSKNNNQSSLTANDLKNFEIRSGYQLINSEASYQNFLKKLSAEKEFAIDTETDGLDPFQNNLIGLSFCWQIGQAYYLPISLITKQKKLTAELASILADKKFKKIGHNIKFDLEVLNSAGFQLNGLAFDTMIASYLLNPGTRGHNLDALVFTEFGYEMTPIESLLGPKGKNQLTMAEIALPRVADYSAEDADYTWRLYEKLKKQLLTNNLLDLMDKIETPLIPVLASMEKNGVLLDIKFLKKMSGEVTARLDILEKNIYKIAGKNFNVRSPLQLKEILFDKLNISTQGLGRTKTGISTAASELDKLAGAHPIVDLILEHRELAKLKSTYTDALPELISKKTGRLRTSFNQTVTATGRLSSSEPNLQNIPIRTELGRQIRQAFIAPPDYQIVAIDYSQVELRIAAAMSGDQKMITAFRHGDDIHRLTAAEVFDVPMDKVTPDMRRKAKEVNFGILYGLGPRGLSLRTGVSYDEALAFIDKYFTVFSTLKEYLEETIALAHSQEYVETIFGRRRYLPEINAEHQGIRAAAERAAVNHPFQGSAADLIKIAMINIHRLITEKFAPDDVKMILQVHDELVFEIKTNLAHEIAKLIQTEMESAVKLKVPIVADISLGKNWGECK